MPQFEPGSTFSRERTFSADVLSGNIRGIVRR